MDNPTVQIPFLFTINAFFAKGPPVPWYVQCLENGCAHFFAAKGDLRGRRPRRDGSHPCFSFPVDLDSSSILYILSKFLIENPSKMIGCAKEP